MKRMNLRKTLSGAALIGAMIVGTTALADPPQGGYGPDYGKTEAAKAKELKVKVE